MVWAKAHPRLWLVLVPGVITSIAIYVVAAAGLLVFSPLPIELNPFLTSSLCDTESKQ